LELVSISKEGNMLLTEQFVSSLIKKIHGQHPDSPDGWRYLEPIPKIDKHLA